MYSSAGRIVESSSGSGKTKSARHDTCKASNRLYSGSHSCSKGTNIRLIDHSPSPLKVAVTHEMAASSTAAANMTWLAIMLRLLCECRCGNGGPDAAASHSRRQAGARHLHFPAGKCQLEAATVIRGRHSEVGVARSRKLAEPTLPADTAPIADQTPCV